MKKKLSKAETYAEELRRFALTYPLATEDHPWGEVVVKVNKKKIFLFSGTGTNGVGISVKLGLSQTDALDYPFTEPTGYGLGKHGWVSARFAAKDSVPIDLLKAWIDESFRNVAPKKLVKILDAEQADDAPNAATKKAATRTGGKKLTATKKTAANNAGASARKKKSKPRT